MPKEKDFISPAAQFFNDMEKEPDTTPAAIEEADAHPGSTLKPTDPPPEGYKIDPRFIEKKTKRVQLVLQPSLYKRAQKAAKKQKISFNEMVHQLLNEYLTEFEKERKK